MGKQDSPIVNSTKISVVNVNKKYNGQIVLEDISFDIKEGEFVSILGSSGCGKTTLLKILIGIEKPDTGEILKDGEGITNNQPSKRGMGLVFQNYALFPNMSVWGNVAYALRGLKVSRPVLDKIKEQVLLIDKESIKQKKIEIKKAKKEIKDAKAMRNIRYICAEKWTLLFGGTSAGLIFLTKYLDGIAISGLAAVAMAKQDELKSLAEKTKELVGEEKFKEIEEKTLEDKVLKNFVKDEENYAIKPYHRGGKIWIDTETGAMFQMDENDLKAVLERAEDYCARNHYLYQDKFFDMLGIEPPEEKVTHVRRWGPKNPFKASLGTQTCFGATFCSIEYECKPETVFNY